MTSGTVTIEIGTSTARWVATTFDKAEVDTLYLHPVATASNGTFLTGAEAVERLQVASTAGAGAYLSRIGDSVPIHIDGSPWAAHDVLASVLAQHLREYHGDVLRVVAPPEWGPHRRDLVRTALLTRGIGEVELVSATDAILNAAQDAIPEACSRVLIVNATDGRISATAVSRATDETSAGWQVTAIAGQDFGGTDVDDALLGFVTARVAPPSSVTAAEQLRANCRSAREQLSTQPIAVLEVPGSEEKLRLVRADLETLSGLALRTALSALLLRVGVSTTADATPAPASGLVVDLVLLTGGLATMPLLVETLSELLALPVHVPSDPTTVALRGAAAMPVPDPEPTTIEETDQKVVRTRPWARLQAVRELRVLVPSWRTVGIMVAALALMIALPLGARGLPDDLAGIIRGIDGSGPAKILVVNAPGAAAAVGESGRPAEAMAAGMDVAALPVGGQPAPWMIGTMKGVATTKPNAGNNEGTRPSTMTEPSEDPASLRGASTASDPTAAADRAHATSVAPPSRMSKPSPRPTGKASTVTAHAPPGATHRPTTSATRPTASAAQQPTSKPSTVAPAPVSVDPPTEPSANAPQSPSAVSTTAPAGSPSPLPVVDTPASPAGEPPADEADPDIGGDSEVDRP